MASENFVDKEWDKLWDDLDSIKKPKTFHEQTKSFAKTKNIKSSDFGIGAMMLGNYQDPVAGLQAQIRAGAGHIEFSPAALGGGGQQTDFGKIGKQRRQALKEIAKINKTTIHTHAHPGITGMSGWDPQRGFSEETSEFGKQEVKKAIEFASEIEQGGPITLHAGEFMRPLQGQNGGNDFLQSKEELDKLNLMIVDKEQKQVMQDRRVQVSQRVSAPVFDYSSEKEITIDGIGKQYKLNAIKHDEKGNPLWKEFDNFKEYTAFLAKNDDKFKEQAKKELGISSFDSYEKTNNDGNIEIADYYLMELAAKIKTQNEFRLQLARSANQQFSQTQRQLSELKRIENGLEKAKKQAKNDNEDVYLSASYRLGTGRVIEEDRVEALIESGEVDKDDFIKISKDGTYEDAVVETQLGEYRLGNLQNEKAQIETQQLDVKGQIEGYFKKIDTDFETVSKYAKETASQNYAEIALDAYEKNKQLKKKNPDATPLYLAIENLFPERYGSRPDELLGVITDARAEFSKQLQHKGVDKKKATQIANETIKATFDTGHLNMWRKHFRFKEGESDEARDKKFQKWALAQTQKLVDAGVVGNIHMADNFGYGDDHLSPGEGNVPIREYMEMFDKAKGDEKIGKRVKIAVEGGFDENQNGVHEAWKQTGAQVFRSQQATDAWVNPESSKGSSFGYQQVSNNYLGNYNKPAFIFGKYSPDQNEWAPWSETTLE